MASIKLKEVTIESIHEEPLGANGKPEYQRRICRVLESITYGENKDKTMENRYDLGVRKSEWDKLDKFSPGNIVDAEVYLNGNYWEKGNKCFVNLNIGSIELSQNDNTIHEETVNEQFEESDDLPF